MFESLIIEQQIDRLFLDSRETALFLPLTLDPDQPGSVVGVIAHVQEVSTCIQL